MIQLEHATKKYGDTIAVHDLSFTVEPGVVTGFLGPNGSGKSTTMRMVLGLDRPTSGRALVNGKRYHDLTNPLREVGALLDAKALHPGRSARNHLRALAASNKIPFSRVDEVLGIVGLDAVANKKAGGFSLGMGQRLGIAGAILGDPGVLLFDEPVNGLDPEGIRWVREFFHSLAAEGRTVFVSSHLMSEMALTAHQLIVIGRGELIRHGTVSELTATAGGSVLVRSPQIDELTVAIAALGGSVASHRDDAIEFAGITAEQIGVAALDRGIALYELTPQRASLEEAFMEMTASSVEFSGQPLSEGNHA